MSPSWREVPKMTMESVIRGLRRTGRSGPMDDAAKAIVYAESNKCLIPRYRSASRGRSISSPGAASPPCAILEEGVSLPSPGARQRHFDAQRVVQHFNARRRSLAERAHAEAQYISFPSLLLHRDHRSEVTVGAGEALFETADRLDLPEMMADDDCDSIAHGNCNRVTWTCMRAIMI